MSAERERAVLVGLSLRREGENGASSRTGVEEHLEELAQLVDTAGAQVVYRVIQGRISIDAAFFIGKGKAEELAALTREHDIQLVAFDDDLSPVQLRNLEELIERKVIDRSGIILDIFASRARTSEAKTQVELAQLQYMLPRLTRQWTHLSKQYGGIGTKGPGETQIETDRRAIRTKISHLRVRLRRIGKERAEQRKGREQFPRAALVGYTNAGKSTLMNRLTGADVLVENRLFATLDSTVRLAHLPPPHKLLLSDTVGFIRKLPAHLVASFKSTLDELHEADILLHVVDVSHPAWEEQMAVVNDTLSEIGVTRPHVLTVFNKTDRVPHLDTLRSLSQSFPQAVFISASRGINLGELEQRLIRILDEDFVEETLTIGHDNPHVVARIHELGQIIEKQYTEDGTTIRFRIERKKSGMIHKMIHDS